MEQDKQLKEILLNSAERPSADFTAAVMQRVTALSEDQLSYEPLVSPKLKRVFVFIFGALIAAIIGLCVLIAIINLPFFTRIQNIAIPGLDYQTIFIFIFSFWFVFTINSIFNKSSSTGKGSHIGAS